MDKLEELGEKWLEAEEDRSKEIDDNFIRLSNAINILASKVNKLIDIYNWDKPDNEKIR